LQFENSLFCGRERKKKKNLLRIRRVTAKWNRQSLHGWRRKFTPKKDVGGGNREKTTLFNAKGGPEKKKKKKLRFKTGRKWTSTTAHKDAKTEGKKKERVVRGYKGKKGSSWEKGKGRPLTENGKC